MCVACRTLLFLTLSLWRRQIIHLANSPEICVEMLICSARLSLATVFQATKRVELFLQRTQNIVTFSGPAVQVFLIYVINFFLSSKSPKFKKIFEKYFRLNFIICMSCSCGSICVLQVTILRFLSFLNHCYYILSRSKVLAIVLCSCYIICGFRYTSS